MSAKHSQQRDRARDGNGNDSHISPVHAPQRSPSVPGIFGTNWRADDVSLACFLRTAQRATCGGGCASISVRWHSRERESYRIAQCFSEGRSRARWADRARVSHCPRLEGATDPQMCVVRVLRAVMSIQTPLLYVIEGGFCQFPHRTVSSSIGWPMAARLMADAPKVTCGPE